MRGTQPVCTTCEPCEQHPCCAQGGFDIFRLVLTHTGCCDCLSVKVHATWNFTGSPIPTINTDPCGTPPETETPSNFPECLESAIAAHGGGPVVEIYLGLNAGFWPEYQQPGIPDYVVAGDSGFVLLNRECLDGTPTLLCGDTTGWITEGQCVECTEGVKPQCNWKILDGRVGFIVRTATGYEALRCVRCIDNGEDVPLPPCSSSSSSSSSSSGTSSSSSSTSSDSSSSSSSSTTVDPPSSSSSSSSSDTSSSSSSSSSACGSCYVRLSASDLPVMGGVSMSVLAEVVFPDPSCATFGTWSVSANEHSANNSDPVFEVEACTTYTITATFTGDNGVTCTEVISHRTACPSSSSSS